MRIYMGVIIFCNRIDFLFYCQQKRLLCPVYIYEIYNITINKKMQWLAGKTHKLTKNDLSMHSMGRAIDCLEKALVEIEKDSAKILDEEFMMNIFNEFTGTIPKFNIWNKYMFEDKVTPAIDKIGSNIADYYNSKHNFFSFSD